MSFVLGTRFRWSRIVGQTGSQNHLFLSLPPLSRAPLILPACPLARVRPIPPLALLRAPPTSLEVGWRRWQVSEAPLTRYRCETWAATFTNGLSRMEPQTLNSPPTLQMHAVRRGKKFVLDIYCCPQKQIFWDFRLEKENQASFG